MRRRGGIAWPKRAGRPRRGCGDQAREGTAALDTTSVAETIHQALTVATEAAHGRRLALREARLSAGGRRSRWSRSTPPTAATRWIGSSVARRARAPREGGRAVRRSRRLGFPWGRLPNGQRRTRSRRRPRARSHGREGRAAARPRCASTRPGRSTSAARPARTVRCAIARSSRRTCRWSASSLAGAPATMVSRSIHSSCRVRPSVRRRKPRRSSTAVDLAPSRTSALTNRSTGVSFSC